ncbi:MAG: hypothetical protein ABIP03_09060 [Aquihabitans sp.]
MRTAHSRWAPTGWRQFLPPPQRLVVSDGELAALIVCTLVTTVGLAGDIARHLQNPDNLAGDFLSGWHLVLYGGVASVGVWIALGALRRGPAFVGSVPTTTLGFMILSAGGAVDALWHEVFGTEKAVEALVSPPHLVVFTGLMCLLTSPLVLLWTRPIKRLEWVPSVAATVSVVSALLVTTLFTGFLSPMASGLSLQPGYVEPLVGESLADYDQVRGLGIAIWTAALVAAGFSILLTRFRIKPGLLLLGFIAIGVPGVVLSAGAGLSGSTSLAQATSLPMFYGFVAGGIVFELGVLLWARPTLGRATASVVCGVASAMIWAVTFFFLHLDHRLGWEEALGAGAITLSGLVGATVAALVTLPVPGISASKLQGEDAAVER